MTPAQKQAAAAKGKKTKVHDETKTNITGEEESSRYPLKEEDNTFGSIADDSIMDDGGKNKSPDKEKLLGTANATRKGSGNQESRTTKQSKTSCYE